MRAALVTIHGMGRAKKTYAETLRRALYKRLGDSKDDLHFESIYYEDLLSPNQTRVWKACSGTLRWKALRRFALFFLADAGALESRKSEPDSAYVRVQVRIASAFYRACQKTGPDAPLTLFAHSLGCQVVSNYLWDAQKHRERGSSNVGIWIDPHKHVDQITGGRPWSETELDFIRGRTLRYIYTTGCNIPMFVAGHAEAAIEPIAPLDGRFEWHNFYDQDDALGWPLQVLSGSYQQLVRDHQVNVGGGWRGWLLASWNPFSHGEYWREKKILAHLHGRLVRLLRSRRLRTLTVSGRPAID